MNRKTTLNAQLENLKAKFNKAAREWALSIVIGSNDFEYIEDRKIYTSANTADKAIELVEFVEANKKSLDAPLEETEVKEIKTVLELQESFLKNLTRNGANEARDKVAAATARVEGIKPAPNKVRIISAL